MAAVTIIDTSTKGWTLAEIMLLQGHAMNTQTAADGTTRAFSDDTICTVINNVIRFVYGNSHEDLDLNIELMCVNTLSVLALNNMMLEAGFLPGWQYQDPFDKLRFYGMIETLGEDESAVDVVPMYRNQFHE